MRYGVIYKATNIINQKSYIGLTINFNKRKQTHINSSYNKNNISAYNYIFHRAIRKYGKDNFDWEILCENIPEQHLPEYEKFYIKLYSSYKYGYNATEGGETNPLSDPKIKEKFLKTIRSKKTREKMSLSQKNRTSPRYKLKPMLGEQNPMYGKKLSDEHKNKLSKSHIGKKLSDEAKNKLSEKGCKYTYKIIDPSGKEYITQNISKFCRDNSLNKSALHNIANHKQESHKGYKCIKINSLRDPEWKPCEKPIKEKTNKKLSAKTKNKISEANKGKKRTGQQKDNLSKAKCKHTYQITNPTGQVFIVKSITKFCQDNLLTHSKMYDVINGKLKSYKGYTAIRLPKTI